MPLYRSDEPGILSYRQKASLAATLRQGEPSVLVVTGGDSQRAPSDASSLKSLARAFESAGIRTILHDIGDRRHVSANAAFIRTYTEVDGDAHKLAVEFEGAGLPVLDRPSSIIRGCDKVHQSLLFSRAGVPCPNTAVLKKAAHAKAAQLRIGSWPIVVKDPCGAFCSGISMVNTVEELEAAVAEACLRSGAAVVQAFVVSEFDWRIGMIDHEFLFAAKYWMAPGSWKIHEKHKDGANWGLCEPVPLREVPGPVLQAAFAASSATGPGLWGIDIKLVGQEALVIEINDNPNIDDDVEAAVDADRVWHRLAGWFSHRMEDSKPLLAGPEGQRLYSA